MEKNIIEISPNICIWCVGLSDSEIDIIKSLNLFFDKPRDIEDIYNKIKQDNRIKNIIVIPGSNTFFSFCIIQKVIL